MKEILEPPSKAEIPQNLIEKFSNERRKEDQITKRNEEFAESDPIFIISQDLILNWYSFGYFPCTKKIQQESSLLKNPNFRKKLYVSKKLTFYQFSFRLLELLQNPDISCVLIYQIGKFRYCNRFRISSKRYIKHGHRDKVHANERFEQGNVFQ